MNTITFYRQARLDGGVRTGVSLDDETVLHEFKRGKDDDNPALLWFIDVRFRGKSVPAEPDDVREFLTAAAPKVREALDAAADELSVGVDADVLPYVREHEVRRGLTVKVVCSANRRATGLQIAKQVRQIAARWTDVLRELKSTVVHT